MILAGVGQGKVLVWQEIDGRFIDKYQAMQFISLFEVQLGLGVRPTSVSMIVAQGVPVATGGDLDLAIEGGTQESEPVTDLAVDDGRGELVGVEPEVPLPAPLDSFA